MTFLNNKNKNKNSSSLRFVAGFTLVETLVALFIFSISILTAMSVLSKGVGNIIYTKNKISAEYLAQEGIEYFRNMRDTYMISKSDKNAGWDDFITAVVPLCASGCRFNSDESSFGSSGIKSLEINSCSGLPCPVLHYNSSTGIYGYSSGGSTVFSREITTELDGDSLKITSKVTWGPVAGSNTISLSEIVTKWME